MIRDSLSEKNIIVTGSNRGIGKAIVEACAERKANVWACMRTVTAESEEWIHGLADKYHVFITPVPLDLADSESMKKAAKTILSSKCSVNGIINNAGITGPIKTLAMTTMDELYETFAINFFGPIFFTQRLIKNMIRQKAGAIVFISSIAAIDGEPAQFAYVTSKAAIIGATKKLSKELAPYHIRVNCIAPGEVATDMGKRIEKETAQKRLASTSMGRFGEPYEIADVVCFAMSDAASYMTGQVIRIDGGR